MPSASAEGGRRVVSFAGSAVVITWDGAEGERVASFLFGRMPEGGQAEPCATYAIRHVGGAGKLGLYRGDTLIHLGDADGYLAELLMSEVCRLLVTHSHGGMLYHAAGLSRGDGGIMLPGAMTSGKSTLAAWLALQGFAYLTDELVYIPPGADEMQTLIRPLNLRRPSRVALPEGAWQAFSPQPWPSREGDLVPPEALNAEHDWAAPTLRLIVFPRYAPQATPSVRRLSAAETVMTLLHSLVNGARLPERGLPEAARIARRVTAYQATYGHLQELEASLREWLAAW